MNWTGGYVSNIDYTFGYYRELSPLFCNLILLYNGYRAPIIKNACELGIGNGISFLVNSVSSNVNWYGTDFNPSQISFVKDAAKNLNASLNVFDEDFATFCTRDDLPNFDFIGLHGIWSWISDENRNVIIDFLKSRLNVGGVLYISYNTMPGRSSMIPVRELLLNHYETMSVPGAPVAEKIDQAINFVSDFFDAEPKFCSHHPHIVEHVKNLKTQSRAYLAHEYFNRDWKPMSFPEVASLLEQAKLTFAGSANPLESMPNLSMSPDQEGILSPINNLRFKELLTDFVTNQGFRKDIWVKGARTITDAERLEALSNISITLVKARTQVAIKVETPRGQAELNASVYDLILDILDSADEITIADLIRKTSETLTSAQVIEAVFVLLGKADIAAVQDKSAQKGCVENTKLLNDYFCSLSKYKQEATHVASAKIAGAYGLTRFEQLFLVAIRDNFGSAEELAQFVWDIINKQDQKLIVEGTKLLTEEQNLSELQAMAKKFLEDKLPTLQRLNVI